MMVEHWSQLVCHPSSPCDAVRAIQVRADRRSGAELLTAFRLDGDLSRIVVPSPRSRTGNELWRHTCFEVFIAPQGQTAYHEFNFAPSKEWAVYAFSGYRKGGLVTDKTLRPEISVRSTGTRLEMDALVRLDRLSADHPRATLKVSLAAVIETSEGLSYWSLLHPANKPDFHNADGFSLVLESPGSGDA